ncbi:MAG TPA: YCF48-related protein [Ignavibacteria bacterium]|nr:YCF48-related protein [Ignavibacteria bacterium]HMR39483.1 YCF48-related protein [Ignavibacteria bacterium]
MDNKLEPNSDYYFILNYISKLIIVIMEKLIFIILTFLCSTINTQAQWIYQQSGVSSTLNDIEMINENTGRVCGVGGVILKTTNRGASWIQQVTNVPSKPLTGIHPVNDSVVFSVGWFGTILKTTDGGENWIAIQNGVFGDGNYYCLFFINEATGWVSANNMGQGSVKKTIDGGKTFTSSNTFGWPRDMYFKDSLNGVGVDGAATIHRTTNGGNNWQTFPIASSGDLKRVSFINAFTGFVIGGATEILYKTTNFGQTWNNIGFIPNVTGYSTSIAFIDKSTGWVGGTNELYKTTNEGNTWIRQNVSPGVLYSIEPVTDSLVWACGNGGRIWNTIRGGDTITDIKQISYNIPISFELKQNYPNPFNSTTVIEFNLRKNGIYKMDIFNNLGQLVINVFYKKFTEGVYELKYNAEKLTSGIYYYSIQGENNILTKKFILIK